MTHDDVREALAAHALDALDEVEAREVEAHLEVCDECRQTLAGFREVAAVLGSGVRAVEPPASLRARALAALEPRPARAVVPRVWAVAFAAAAASVLILAAINVALTQKVKDLSRQLAEVTLQLDAVNRQVASQDQALALLASPSTRTVVLSGPVLAHVRLVYDPQRRQGVLVASDLQDPGQDRVYQLWLLAGGHPESAGVFRPAAGRPVILPVAAEFGRFQAAAISVERGPAGARQPTAAPILAGSL